MEMVRTLLQLGFEFQLGEGVTAVDPSSLSDQMTDLALQAMRDRIEQLADFKQGVLNACLFWAARKGAVDTIPLLMGSSDTQAGTSRQIRAQINCTDEMRRTPLYVGWCQRVLRERQCVRGCVRMCPSPCAPCRVLMSGGAVCQVPGCPEPPEGGREVVGGFCRRP